MVSTAADAAIERGGIVQPVINRVNAAGTANGVEVLPSY
jgi:hypothetical protein